MPSLLSRFALILGMVGAPLAMPDIAAAQNPTELRPGGDPAPLRLQERIHGEALEEGLSEAADDVPPTADADDERDELAPLAGIALSPDALRGWTVLDESRRELGTITDVIVDPRSGEAKEVVVSAAAGGRLTLPVDTMEPAPGQEALIATGLRRAD